MTALRDSVALVTGGARGIGLATARALREAGARVAIGDIDAAEATRAAAALGSDVQATELDVADPASFVGFVQLAERDLGPVDILVNNAGIMPIGRFTEEPDSLADRTLRINVQGTLIGMKAVLPGMVQRGAGHVVNVASVAGRSPVPGGITYAASKAAIVSATESARVEFRRTGVAFTCVMPSFTATELIAGTKGTKLIATVTPEAVASAIVRGIRHNRADVFVPRSVGAIVKTTPLIGRRVRDAVNRAIGADRTFFDVDLAARAAYAERIAGAPPTDAEAAELAEADRQR